MLQFLLPHLTKLTKWEQTRQDLFDEISSLDLDTIKHNGESHGFGKIDEGNSNYNITFFKNKFFFFFKISDIFLYYLNICLGIYHYKTYK